LKEVEKANRNRKIGSVEKKKKFGKAAPKKIMSEHKPLYSYSGHRDEGFALDWSSKSPGINSIFIFKTYYKSYYKINANFFFFFYQDF